MPKSFQCPMCAFNVKAEMEEEVLKHAKMHAQEKHPETKMTDAELCEMIK